MGRLGTAVDAETLVGTACQGTQHRTLVPLEAIHWALARRTVPTHVGRALQPEEAWAAATHVPGTFLGVPKLGTLQDGAPADFVIFSQDPTQDLRHLDTFEAVVADGRLYTKARLESAFERIHAHYDNPLVNTARETLFSLLF